MMGRLSWCLLVALAWILCSGGADDVVSANFTAPALSPTPTPTLSGCQVCASSGNCARAYLDSPGHFCGNWLDRASQRQRCCCARDATCHVSNYACNCKRRQSSNRRRQTGANWGIVAGVGTVLVFCSGCLCMCCKRSQYERRSAPPVVYVSPMYAPIQPSYVGGYGYSGGFGYNDGRHDGMDSGSSALLGGAVGLVGGVAIGHALADAGDAGYGGGGYDGGCDDGGGGDSGGDF